LNQGLKEGVLNFKRPFDITNTTAARVTMDIDWQKDYWILMNWGVFASHEDTSGEYMYGARNMQHA